MKRLLILAVLTFAGCTPGGHLYMGNHPLCPTATYSDDFHTPGMNYLKGAVVCWNGKAYLAKVDQPTPMVPPPDKRYWKVY